MLLEVAGARLRIGEATILAGADLVLEPGLLVAVVGPNGAGKSTLVRVAAGLQRLSEGAVRWEGTDVARLRGRRLALLRAYVPQRSQVPDGVSVREAVRLGRAPHLRPLARMGRHDHEAVEVALERTGVEGLGDRRLTTLSGGELQRVQIAVALAQGAPALIADEPTSHLDLGAASEMARLLRGLADDGMAVLLVVHDLALAAAVADVVVVMSEGRSVAAGLPSVVLDRERLARVWHVDAALETSGPGHTALHVAWLGRARAPQQMPNVSDPSPIPESHLA